jgi:integrase/recombinase XerD
MLIIREPHVRVGEEMSETSIDQIVSMEIERFGAHLKADRKSPSTIKQYLEAVAWLLRSAEKRPEDLTADDLQRFKEQIAERYSENTMYSRVVAVNQYMERMVHRPDLKIRPPRMVIITKIPLTENEMEAIRKAASNGRAGRRDVALIDVMYYGGLRCAEVSQLTLSCLDLEAKRLRVNAGKGKNYDMVNLSPEAVKSLREYIEQERPEPVEGAEDHLFLGRGGEPLCKTQIWKITKRVAFEAGISKNVHPHIFRHSMITHMAEKGLSASFIQAQSRHKSLDMVARYTHLSEKVVRDAYDMAFTVPPQEPVKPAPVTPAPAPIVQPSALSVRERILTKYLDGEIDDSKLERLLSLADGEGIAPKPGPLVGYQ